MDVAKRELQKGREFKTARSLDAFAAGIAEQFPAHQVLVLLGNLGAGKTTFVRGLVRGLGYAGEVTSPTYTYMHEYNTPQGKFLHVDAYRLDDARKLWQLGLSEQIETSRLVAIEWGEPLISELQNPLLLRFEILPKGRRLTMNDSL